jgi:hypothetical protein
MRNNKPSGKNSRGAESDETSHGRAGGANTPHRFGARRVMRTGVSIIKPLRGTAGYRNGYG